MGTVVLRRDYCLIDAGHDEILDGVDPDALLQDVARLMGVDVEAVMDAYRASPLRIMVRPGAEIRDLMVRLEGSCGADTLGLCLSATLILVVRLDWKGLLAHEMAHAIARLLKMPPSEREARRVADAVTWQALREQTQLDAS